MKLNHPHDSLFKNAFSDPRAARMLVEPSLPPVVVERLEGVRLRRLSTEYQTLQGRSSFCDLVFELELKGEGPVLFLHLHLEHQSKVVQEMIYRCVAYAGHLLYQVIGEGNNKSCSPAVLSVVVSNAEKRWDAPQQLAETYALRGAMAEQLMPLLTHHSYALIDLFELGDDELKDRAWAAWQHLALCLLRKGRDEDVVEMIEAQRALVEEVANTAKGRDRLNLSLWYIDGVNKHEAVNPQVVNDALASAGTQSHRHARANWEAYEDGLRAEGEQRGREEGRLEGRREALLDQLEENFGALTQAQRARVLAADEAKLKKWALRVGRADSLDATISDV